ncbi:phosphoadenosine phosphosulfate reductase family protein [Streptomyces sp. NPDC056544]|uniref:phosphoadenosine phosphosulfate reductase domain-containing protein n=1 Tax=unclassified Streptomyces TaxID=2593676 RepID=UPI00368C3E25
MKFAPIAWWTQEYVDAYVAANGVLLNPLLWEGYTGCSPLSCTRKPVEGEDSRAGRWAELRQDRVRHPPLSTPNHCRTRITTDREEPEL